VDPCQIHLPFASGSAPNAGRKPCWQMSAAQAAAQERVQRKLRLKSECSASCGSKTKQRSETALSSVGRRVRLSVRESFCKCVTQNIRVGGCTFKPNKSKVRGNPKPQNYGSFVYSNFKPRLLRHTAHSIQRTCVHHLFCT
jgi:hypothetical protein